MAKKKEIEEEEVIQEEETTVEPFACASPSCGHQITTSICPYCGYEN